MKSNNEKIAEEMLQMNNEKINAEVSLQITN